MTQATLLSSLQEAIITRLQGDATLGSMVNGIFDDVPQGTTLPYVTLASQRVANRSSVTGLTTEISMTLTIWSDYAGQKEGLDIAAQVQSLLTPDALSLPTGTLYSLILRGQSADTLRDGATRRVQLSYEAVVGL